MTGGSGGIGSYVVSQLLDEGAAVLILSRRSNVPAQAVHVSADLSTIDGIAHAQKVIAREKPDILVNLAGVPCFGLFEDQSLEDLHKNYLINLVAPVSLCQACLPAMKARGSGHIVNVGSIMGRFRLPILQATRAPNPDYAHSAKRCGGNWRAAKSR